MLRIRKKQMEALAVRDFEDAMAAHLAEYFPRHVETLGEERIQDLARLGLSRARSHGLVAERSAQTYVDLMFLLGSGFATDPQLPWARAILEDASIVAEATRVDFLYDQAMVHVDRLAADIEALVDGPDRARFAAEVEAIRQEPNEAFSDGSDTSALERRLASRLRSAFPRKGGVLGTAGLLRVAAGAVATARRHGLSTPRGATVCAVFMFVAGSSFDAEPQLPWVAAMLADPLPEGPSERADRLLDGMIAFFTAWLA